MEEKWIDWNKLAGLLALRGMSQGSLGEAIGHSRSYLSGTKARGGQPTKIEKLAMCGILGCSLEDIETSEPDPVQEAKAANDKMAVVNRRLEAIDKLMNTIEQRLDTIETNTEAVRKLLAGREGVAVMSQRLGDLMERVEALSVPSNGDDFGAEKLILSMMQEGLIEEQALMNKAAQSGVTKQQIQRAKNRLGLIVIARGYGSNKKRYYELRRE